MTWIPRSYPIAQSTITFSVTPGDTVDSLVFTIPASPTGNARFILSRMIIRTDGIGGADTGSVDVSVGTTAGGFDIITPQTISNFTPASVVGGVSISSLGTAMTAANGYELVMNPGDTINFQAATSVDGTISAGFTAKAYVYGYYLP